MCAVDPLILRGALTLQVVVMRTNLRRGLSMNESSVSPFRIVLELMKSRPASQAWVISVVDPEGFTMSVLCSA